MKFFPITNHAQEGLDICMRYFQTRTDNRLVLKKKIKNCNLHVVLIGKDQINHDLVAKTPIDTKILVTIASAWAKNDGSGVSESSTIPFFQTIQEYGEPLHIMSNSYSKRVWSFREKPLKNKYIIF